MGRKMGKIKAKMIDMGMMGNRILPTMIILRLSVLQSNSIKISLKTRTEVGFLS